MIESGVRCATDITGYGLLGHLREVVEASDVSAVVHADRVPVLDGVVELIEQGVYPSGSVRNLESVASIVDTSVDPDHDEDPGRCANKRRTAHDHPCRSGGYAG